ncbi:MAG: hypothetical protein MJ093_03170 [Saccharofermentans sp.]|nr:hypothetical protein [Saccharofermentans sp.]
MKNRLASTILAASLVASVAIAGTGCSKDDDSDKKSNERDETKVEETEETEESEETTAVEETHNSSNVELTGITNDLLLSAVWKDTDDGDVDAATTIPTYTNVDEIELSLDWNPDEALSMAYTIDLDDQEAVMSSQGWFGFIKVDDFNHAPLNEFGYLPTGTYKINLKVNDEQAIVAVANVIFDESTAEISTILTEKISDSSFTEFYYTDSSFSNMLFFIKDGYEAGDEGIFLMLGAPMMEENGTYKAVLSLDGEVIATDTVSYEGFTNSIVNISLTPDGGLKSGEYKVDYIYNDALYAIATITVK